MKDHNLKLFALTPLIVALFITQLASERYMVTVESSPNESEQQACLTKRELALTVQEFSSRRSYPELERARRRLLDNAKLSAACRGQVIAALIEAMDRPQIDLMRDFHLWRYGSDLLPELKGTEGLDLLIKHLSLTDGTSPMNVSHYPAMGGVIKFGPTAIPKLGAALQQNTDRNYRLRAIFCIAQIGGPTAVPVLRNALSSESDSCARRFIQVSIDALSNPQAPGEITVQDREKWFAAFSCNP